MIRLYLMTLMVFAASDTVWLGWVAPKFYEAQIGHLLAAVPNWYAALSFYLLYMAGLVVFAVRPGLRDTKWHTTLLRGGFFGFITYATFDLTCMAVMKDWPLMMTVVDMAWGTILNAVVTLVTVQISRRWFGMRD